MRLGEDPAGQKIESRARAAETLGSVLQPYLLHKKAGLKPRTYEEAERHLLIHAKRLHGLRELPSHWRLRQLQYVGFRVLEHQHDQSGVGCRPRR